MITLMSLTEEERDEYAEIVAVIADYQKYINLHHLHCCKMEGDSWVFVPEMEERNKIFYEGWPERKKKIIARIKADKYFVRNGKIGDKKELRKKDAKYEDLTVYYSLKSKFFALEKILSQNSNVSLVAHINALRQRRAELEEKTITTSLAGVERASKEKLSETVVEMTTLIPEKPKTKN